MHTVFHNGNTILEIKDYHLQMIVEALDYVQWNMASENVSVYKNLDAADGLQETIDLKRHLQNGLDEGGPVYIEVTRG